jgi:hypothetical protein
MGESTMKRCPACGAENNPYVETCVGCGRELPSAAEAAVEARAAMTPEEIFVGENYGYFQRKWLAMQARDGYQSWNWAAFFFTPYWLLYRRLYAYFAIYLVAIAGLIGIEVLFTISDAVARAMHIALAAVAGMFGNYGYRMHMQRKLSAVAGSGSPEQVRAALARAGGTSAAGPSLLMIAMVVLALFMLANPD